MSLAWRIIVFVSVTLNVISTLGILYGIYAFQDSLYLFKHSRIETLADFDTVAAAAMVGRLDIVSLLLAFVGILVAIVGIGGVWYSRREAVGAAQSEAQTVVPDEVQKYMNNDGSSIIRECLDDADIVARLQRKFIELQIEDTDEAFDVDTDPEWREG